MLMKIASILNVDARRLINDGINKEYDDNIYKDN